MTHTHKAVFIARLTGQAPRTPIGPRLNYLFTLTIYKTTSKNTQPLIKAT